MAKLIKQPGSPYWYARFMVDGKDYWISTKKKNKNDAKVVAEAEEQKRRGHGTLDGYFSGLLELLDKLTTDDQHKKRQEYARRLLRGQASVLKAGEAWESWLASPIKGNPSQRTIQGYEAIWTRFEPWIMKQGIEFLHEITPLHAQSYSADLWKSRVSPATYNAHVKFLRSMFNALEDLAGLTVNPWHRIKLLDRETQGRRNFTPEELVTICSKATGSFRYMIGIGLYTGLRLGDTVNLRWSDIHRDRIEVIPMKTRRKGKKITLPVHPVLATLLHELQRKSRREYLFPSERKAYQKNAAFVTSRFQAFLSETCKIKTTEAPTGHRRRAAVIKGFHSLRHSFVSLCAANRVPQVAIQELVGHGSPAMTELYSHADFDQKQTAIAALPAVDFEKHSKNSRDTVRPSQ